MEPTNTTALEPVENLWYGAGGGGLAVLRLLYSCYLHNAQLFCTGSQLKNNVMVGSSQKEPYVGDEARFKRGVLHLQYPTPIAKGVVRNWDKMEQVAHFYSYTRMQIY